MIIKMCSRCRKTVVYPARYCETCLPVVEAEREAREQEQRRAANRAYNKRRDPKYVQFYKGRQWRMLSARYLQDHGYKCEGCGGLACEVHHMDLLDKGHALRNGGRYDGNQHVTNAANHATESFQRKLEEVIHDAGSEG